MEFLLEVVNSVYTASVDILLQGINKNGGTKLWSGQKRLG